jgi:hypothetical protein
MKIELINGTFSRDEALELITDLITTKIKFNEKKISISDQLEDIQFREKKIKKLSEMLMELRTEMISANRINVYTDLLIESSLNATSGVSATKNGDTFTV